MEFDERQKAVSLKKKLARRRVLFKKAFGVESPEIMGLQKELVWLESGLTVINQNGVPEVESDDHVVVKVEVRRLLSCQIYISRTLTTHDLLSLSSA